MENSTTTTKHDVREHRKDRPWVKCRVFTGIDPDESEPMGPRCSDPTCESLYCRPDVPDIQPNVDHKVWKAWRRRAIVNVRAKLVPILAEHLGVEPELVVIRHSSKAGCSCGCSPGWIIESPDTRHRPNDIWVD